MKIIHTSDWHLGKTIEGFPRYEEQIAIMEEIKKIVEEKEPEIVIIAGDIYDTFNPPAEAERLFYDYIKKISGGGKRAVIVIAGNHDNPERLVAANPLAHEHGVIIIGKPGERIINGSYGMFYAEQKGNYSIKLTINGESAVIGLLPYANEKRLGEIFLETSDDLGLQNEYEARINQIITEINSSYTGEANRIFAGHLYVNSAVTSDSERSIQIGGAYAVDIDSLPDALYSALGHLHRPQRVGAEGRNVFYSGSPIQYSKSEAYQPKYVNLATLADGSVSYEKIPLANIKPIEIFRAKNFGEAVRYIEDNKEKKMWLYLEIETEQVLTREEIRTIKELKEDVLEIIPILNGLHGDEVATEYYEGEDIYALFRNYYKFRMEAEIPEELMNMFGNIIASEGAENETNIIEN